MGVKLANEALTNQKRADLQNEVTEQVNFEAGSQYSHWELCLMYNRIKQSMKKRHDTKAIKKEKELWQYKKSSSKTNRGVGPATLRESNDNKAYDEHAKSLPLDPAPTKFNKLSKKNASK